MKIKRNLLLIVLTIFNIIINNISAQDLSKLSEVERNKKLIETAKAVYKAPRLKNFYREYGTPTITEMRTRTLPIAERNKISNDPKNTWYGSSNNQKFYIVYFPYDLNKERFDENYAAKVYIWENTGKAFAIGLGNTIMFDVRNGKIPDHNKTPTPEKYYTITYSKDVPNAASLPKTGKRGDIITISLKNIVSIGYDGWTREQGYNFEPEKDLFGGEVIHDYTTTEHKTPTYKRDVRTIKIMVIGNMKVNIRSYVEEYEDL